MQSRKWFWFSILYQNIFAYVISLCVYQIGSLFMGEKFGVGSIVALVCAAGILYMLFRPDPNKEVKGYAKRSVQSVARVHDSGQDKGFAVR